MSRTQAVADAVAGQAPATPVAPPRGVPCAFCGLPVPGLTMPAGPLPEAAAEPAYCCFGCRFADAVVHERAPTGKASSSLTRLGLGVFLAMNVMVFTMALWSRDVYPAAATEGTGLATSFESVFRYLGLLFTLPVLWLLGLPLAAGAWKSLKRGVAGSDLLLVSGVLAATVYSAVSVFRGAGHVYFEVACVVLVMVTLGRWLEATGKQKATAALDQLARLLPATVRRLDDDSCTAASDIPLAQVVRGDRLRVLAGERLPVDGRIERGSAWIDQQIVTGESQPALCRVGDDVFGGTLNVDGDLVLQVTAGPYEGTLQRLVDAVERARWVKGRYQQLADRVSQYFLPLVILLALGTFGWHGWQHGLDRGLLAGMAVILIACPCALGLATPLAAWRALGAASRRQVLFANVKAIERLASVEALAWDKTGTLTTGEATLTDWAIASSETASSETTAALQQVLALSQASTHTLARSLTAELPTLLADMTTALEARPATVSEARTHAGRGLEARLVIDGQSGTAWLGSRRWLEELELAFPAALRQTCLDLEASGKSVVLAGWNGAVQAVFAFDEQLRPEVDTALAACAALRLPSEVFTGDHAQRGATLAARLGISVQAALLPEGKVAAVQARRAALGPVAMIGDGVNDAPALAAADVGIALGCGADVSRQSADVCLLGNDLNRVAWSVDLARQTVRVMRQNLAWAFLYNLAGIGLAMSGRLNPIWAAVAMLLSSVLVISNSLRLGREDDATATAGALMEDAGPLVGAEPLPPKATIAEGAAVHG